MTDFDDTQAPQAPTTVRESLRAQRDKVRAKLFTDILVPRYDPPVYVRVSPISGEEVEKNQKTLEKSKRANRAAHTAATALAKNVVGVCELIDGQKVSIDRDDPEGPWPKFDERLAEIAGIEGAAGAADVVLEFFFTDGDVISAVGELYEFSGFSNEKIEADYAGN
jgi:hypothetical protein